ncbi:MAG: hypothetical protein ABI818_08300, partial [Acidobacteriota bacterium]
SSYNARGGAEYRFSLDAEFIGHVGSKSEAEKIAATLRTAIDAGTFERVAERRAREDDRALLATVQAHRAADGRRLGEWLLAAITEDALEAVHTAQRAAGRAVSTLNHLVQVVTASFRWAARKGCLDRSPISADSSLTRGKVAKRERRLAPDEETALLAAAEALSRQGAGLRLSGLIVAALETGCRAGELLGAAMGARRSAAADAPRPGSGGRCAQDRDVAAVADLGASRGRPRDGDDRSGGADLCADGLRVRALRRAHPQRRQGLANVRAPRPWARARVDAER